MATVRDLSPERRLWLFSQSATSSAIVLLDPSGLILDWSPGAQQLFGWSPEEATNQSVSIIYPQEDVTAGAVGVELAAARENRQLAEIRCHVRQDGSRFFADCVTSAIYDDQGALVGFGKLLKKAHSAFDHLAPEQNSANSPERAFLAAILESMEDGVVACDAKGILSVFNRAARELHGLGERSLPPEEWSEYYDLYRADGTTPLPMAEIPLFRAFSGENLQGVEMVVVSKGGKRHRVLCTGGPLQDESGNKLGAVVTLNDVTLEHEAIKAREAAIAEQARRSELEAIAAQTQKREERLKLLDSLNQAIRAEVDPKLILESTTRLLGRFMAVSRCAYATMESDNNRMAIRHEWTNQGTTGTVGIYSLDAFGSTTASSLRRGRTLLISNVDKELSASAGADAFNAIGTKAVIAHPLVKAERLVAIMAVHQSSPRNWTADDVNLLEEVAERSWAHIERARVTEELRASEAHLSSLFEQTAAGIAECDLTGRFITVNDRFCQILGRTREQIIGNHSNEFTHPDDLKRSTEASDRLVSTGQMVELEKRYVRPDGSAVWASTTANLIRTTPDNPTKSALAVVLDVTQRKQAEEELRRADRRKDEFLAMLAHELRNPLAPIGAAADFLRLADVDKTRVKQTSEIISRQVKHMTGLVDDLLDVSRVTRGLITLQQLKLDVKRIASEAVEQVRPLIEAKGHHLAVHMPPAPSFVQGDPKRLVQIVANLLCNAAKYTAEGGNIVLEVNVGHKHVGLSVRDNGIGMAPELVKQAFKLFVQAERACDRSQGGLGIGLALVKSLVELHKGEVSAFSEGKGKGSTFTVTLPKINDRPTDTGGNGRQDALTTATKKLRVMVVDDNTDAAEMLAMLCETLGHQAVVEHSSLRALERARNEAPDLCLLDIGLPDIDGYELARMLRAQPETIHSVLVAVTGYGQEQDRSNALAAGFDHHFIKPIEINRLADLLNKVSQQ